MVLSIRKLLDTAAKSLSAFRIFNKRVVSASSTQQGIGVAQENSAAHAAAYASGFQDGHRCGKQEGFDEGFSAGKNVWEIRDVRPIALPKHRSTSIYGPRRFLITAEMREAMRRKVRDAVNLKVIHDEPTKQQWEMIFSDHPATCVAAGAGSGKSTTLALRVVFMHQYLCIPLSEMTVVSFTTKSCEDLRRSLIAKFAHWNFMLTERAANDLVRTYHSALRRAAVSVGASTNFFEYLGKPKRARSKHGTEQSDSDNYEKASEVNDENPFATALKNKQLDLLHRVYQKSYESNEDFRRNVLGLIRIQLGRDLKVEKLPRSLETASRRDKSLVQFVNDRWREKTDCWPIEGIDEGPHKISIRGMDFFANGKINSTGEPVFLGPAKYNDEWLFANGEILACDDSTLNFSVRGILGIKRQVLSAYLEGTRIYIADTKSAKLLTELVREEKTSRAIRKAPEFSLTLSGEIKPEPITAAFWSQGSFIESVGLDVNDAVGKSDDFYPDSNEYFFVRATCTFLESVQ